MPDAHRKVIQPCGRREPAETAKRKRLPKKLRRRGPNTSRSARASCQPSAPGGRAGVGNDGAAIEVEVVEDPLVGMGERQEGEGDVPRPDVERRRQAEDV